MSGLRLSKAQCMLQNYTQHVLQIRKNIQCPKLYSNTPKTDYDRLREHKSERSYECGRGPHNVILYHSIYSKI